MAARGVEGGWRGTVQPGELLYIPAGCPHALKQYVKLLAHWIMNTMHLIRLLEI
jgi:mannose-6-phosphate isomerase-like protein (cupin superfamily)